MEDASTAGYKDEKYGQSKELSYHYQEGGKYEKVVGFHPEQDRVILQQAWDLFNERAEEARQKVLKGEASPVVYYMEKNLMDPLSLSMMAGISLWRVKRHFKPRVFKGLNEKTLKKYMEAFNVTMDQLKNVQ